MSSLCIFFFSFQAPFLLPMPCPRPPPPAVLRQGSVQLCLPRCVQQHRDVQVLAFIFLTTDSVCVFWPAFPIRGWEQPWGEGRGEPSLLVNFLWEFQCQAKKRLLEFTVPFTGKAACFLGTVEEWGFTISQVIVAKPGAAGAGTAVPSLHALGMAGYPQHAAIGSHSKAAHPLPPGHCSAGLAAIQQGFAVPRLRLGGLKVLPALSTVSYELQVLRDPFAVNEIGWPSVPAP